MRQSTMLNNNNNNGASYPPLRETTNNGMFYGTPTSTRFSSGAGAPTTIKSYLGTRFVTNTDAPQCASTPGHAINNTNNALSTPKTTTRRPLTPQSSVVSCNGHTQPATRQLTTTTTSGIATSRFAHLTPQKPLFQRSLLREIAPGEEAPVLTVVLDLDETLVSNRRADLPQAILRPYVLDALAALRNLPGVEIVMWTASTEETGSQVVRQLHAHGKIFDDVIYRNDDWFTEPVHTKDLRLLGRDMDRVIVVDNAPNCCKLHKGNALLIEDFMGVVTPNDHSLVNMLYVIQALAEGCKKNVSVSQTLEQLSATQEYCYTVNYPVPEAWAHVKPRDVAPVMYPPHGTFFKLHSSVIARHAFRMC